MIDLAPVKPHGIQTHYKFQHRQMESVVSKWSIWWQICQKVVFEENILAISIRNLKLGAQLLDICLSGGGGPHSGLLLLYKSHNA